MAKPEWTRPVSVGDIPTKEMRDAVSGGDREALLGLIEEKGSFQTFKAWTDIAY